MGVEQFLSLDMLDLWGQVIPCCGAALGLVGCSAAALVSPHEMPVAPSPCCDNKNVSRCCHLSPGWGSPTAIDVEESREEIWGKIFASTRSPLSF